VKIDFYPRKQFDQYLKKLIRQALQEDIGEGDHSTNAIYQENTACQAQLLVKDEGIIAGIELASMIFSEYDRDFSFEKIKEDGEYVHKGDIAFRVKASVRSILTCERSVLNFMQRLSAIATKAHKMQQIITPYGCRLLDTRKTTPGLRLLEKWAVRAGGAWNHRIGLYDMILIKDNHIDFTGSLEETLTKVRNYIQSNKLDIPVVVEIRKIEEIETVLKNGGVHRILLDNMNPDEIQKAVDIVKGRIDLEASGGIDASNIELYAKAGVNYISSGAITHSLKAFDLSLKVIA
jgi:nicotinate-nucleotide pyrophosphorylase (carboxylating)